MIYFDENPLVIAFDSRPMGFPLDWEKYWVDQLVMYSDYGEADTWCMKQFVVLF
jgi:hypothetical protein